MSHTLGFNVIPAPHLMRGIQDKPNENDLPWTKGDKQLLFQQPAIHNDINVSLFVIPGLTRNPLFPWIPAGVYPVLDTGREWRALLWLITLCIISG